MSAYFWLTQYLLVKGEEFDVNAAVGLVDGRRGPRDAPVVVQDRLAGIYIVHF